jgi:hypothetical protein
MGVALDPREALGMSQFAIRCHRCVPIDVADLAHWFEQQIAVLRTISPPSTVRLSSLVQTLPDSEVEIGWLLEAETPADEEQRVFTHLRELARDLRLMGLQPTLLAPARSEDQRDALPPTVFNGHVAGGAA